MLVPNNQFVTGTEEGVTDMAHTWPQEQQQQQQQHISLCSATNATPLLLVQPASSIPVPATEQQTKLQLRVLNRKKAMLHHTAVTLHI
jgi:hypothetical protein